MQLSNTRIVPAPPQAVFDALVDPAVLKACIPGCESLERTGDDAFQATVNARVGPVSARFGGRMTMADVDPPRGYALKFEGQGGAAGFAKGEAKVTLDPVAGDKTALSYAVTAQVGGKLAQIGSRLIDGAAAKLAEDFFERFVARFSVATEGSAEGDVEPAGDGASSGARGASATDDARPPVPRSEMGTWTRFVAIAGMIVILAYLYFRSGHWR